MTFTQFVDYLLWSLYLRESTQGAGEFFDLRESAHALRHPVPDQWVFDAGKVLESRRLIRAIFALGGYSAGMLTGEGRLYAEEQLGQEDSFMRSLASDPAPYLEMGVGDLPEPHGPPSLDEQRAPVHAALDELEAAITHSELGEEERGELLADLETIRAQLQKREPNMTVLAGVLEPMSRYPSLSVWVSRLISLLYP